MGVTHRMIINQSYSRTGVVLGVDIHSPRTEIAPATGDWDIPFTKNTSMGQLLKERGLTHINENGDTEKSVLRRDTSPDDSKEQDSSGGFDTVSLEES